MYVDENATGYRARLEVNDVFRSPSPRPAARRQRQIAGSRLDARGADVPVIRRVVFVRDDLDSEGRGRAWLREDRGDAVLEVCGEVGEGGRLQGYSKWHRPGSALIKFERVEWRRTEMALIRCLARRLASRTFPASIGRRRARGLVIYRTRKDGAHQRDVVEKERRLRPRIQVPLLLSLNLRSIAYDRLPRSACRQVSHGASRQYALCSRTWCFTPGISATMNCLMLYS